MRRPDGNTLPTGASSGLGNTTSVDPTSNLSFRLGIPTLPLTGTYTVLITPASNTTGSIQFTLWKDVDTGTLDLDVPKTATVAFGNEQVRMTFAGLIGQSLGVDIANASFGGTVQVIAPNGATQSGPTTFGPAGLGIRTGTLAQSGTYTVIVVPASGATGSLQATLWSDVGGTLTVGALNSVGIVHRNQQSRMSFAGTAGQNLGLDLSNILGFTGGTIQVIAPNGGAQTPPTTFSTAAGIGLRTGTLTQTGSYTVIVVPASAATGTFNLRLWSDVTDSLTIDSPYQLNIPFRNQQARLPFNVTAGQNLGVELGGLTVANIVQVINPNGVALSQVTFTPTATGIGGRIGTLAQGGTYTLVIQQAAGASGTGVERCIRHAGGGRSERCDGAVQEPAGPHDVRGSGRPEHGGGPRECRLRRHGAGDRAERSGAVATGDVYCGGDLDTRRRRPHSVGDLHGDHRSRIGGDWWHPGHALERRDRCADNRCAIPAEHHLSPSVCAATVRWDGRPEPQDHLDRRDLAR